MPFWIWVAWGAGFAAPLSVALICWQRQLRWRRRDDPVQNHQRADNGQPPTKDPRRVWLVAVLGNPWAWVIVALTVFCAFALWVQYMIVFSGLVQSIKATLEELELPVQTLSVDAFNEALLKCAGFAALTLVAYMLIFALLDRFRPATPAMKYVALLWGASGATFVSIYVNSYIGELLAEGASGKEIADAASAIFVAPFVEEAAKAMVLFWLVMAMRRRMCSVLQMVGLAGLSAAGFAFTENIIYYIRLYCTASLIPGIDANEYLHQIALLRGVFTSFGHPLFTMMTAFGLIIGLRQRSKLARIMCPLAGYMIASLLHMCFNGLATILDDFMPLMMIGIMMVIGVTIWLIGQMLGQRQVIAWRLDDYIRMGWLRDRDAVVYSSPMARLKLTTAGWLRGYRTGKATVRLMAGVTELAYLRNAIVNGTNDAGVVGREHELVVDVAAMRGIALDEPVGLRLIPRYRGPAAWHSFKAWRTRRSASLSAAAAKSRQERLPAWTPQQAPWGSPAHV